MLQIKSNYFSSGKFPPFVRRYSTEPLLATRGATNVAPIYVSAVLPSCECSSLVQKGRALTEVLRRSPETLLQTFPETMESVYKRFDSYDFDSDTKFQEGLKLFHRNNKNSSGGGEDKLKDMMLFFYDRSVTTTLHVSSFFTFTTICSAAIKHNFFSYCTAFSANVTCMCPCTDVLPNKRRKKVE